MKKIVKLQKGGKTEKGLKPEQEAFCILYTTGDREFFGNGVQSYIEAYGPDTTAKNWYKNACSAASTILTNSKVIERINELLEEDGLNDQNVDKQLLFLINQFDDKSTKLSALKEYNRLKARIIEKIPVAMTIDVTNMSIKDIEEKRKALLG